MPYPLDVFAANLRRLRHERSLTLERLASDAGVHRTHVSRIERCRCEPGATTIVKLARALDVPIAELFAGLDTPSPAGDRALS